MLKCLADALQIDGLAALNIKPNERDVRARLPAGALLTVIFLQKSYPDDPLQEGESGPNLIHAAVSKIARKKLGEDAWGQRQRMMGPHSCVTSDNSSDSYRIESLLNMPFVQPLLLGRNQTV